MFVVDFKTLLCSFSAIWIFCCQSIECTALCGKPPPILNAQDWYQFTSIGANVSYVCNPGYSLFGPTRRTCQANGKWDGVRPYCFKMCSLPSIPSSMYIAQPINYRRVFKTGEMIILGCKKGLTKQSNGDPIIVCVNGKWTQSSFKCGEEGDKRCVKMLRGLLRNPPNNTIININIRLSKARYRCRGGFMLKGNERRSCFRGRWVEKEQPKCTDYSPCGESSVDFRARIVGGSKSNRGWWPWHVGIYKLNDLGISQLVCGGALISSQWVLTAGSCFTYKNRHTGKYTVYDNTNSYQLKVGDHNLKKNPPAEKSEKTVTLKKIYVHKGFILEKYVNDIALVKLEQKVEFNRFVRTVCLPEKNEGDLVIPTKYGYVAGWGATKALKPGQRAPNHRRYSNVLKHSAYEIQQNRLCGNRSALPFNSTVSFCAGDGKGGNDTCHGDSGGAFVREGKRGDKYRWIVTGLVSWGEGCAQENQYGYYTRVYPFIDWIRKVVAKNTDPHKG